MCCDLNAPKNETSHDCKCGPICQYVSKLIRICCFYLKIQFLTSIIF